MALPISLTTEEGPMASIALWRHSNVICVSLLASAETFPMRKVSDWSPYQPSTIVVRSTLTMSPSSRIWLLGMPWQMTSLMLVQMLFGNGIPAGPG